MAIMYRCPLVLDSVPSWSDGTDAEIAAALQAHYNGEINLYDYWNVGDERTVTLSAMSATGVGESHVQQPVTFVLMNKGGKTLTTSINGHTECAFIVGQKNCLTENGYMNSTAIVTGGWDACARRAWCNSVYKNSIPSDFRALFKEYKNVTANGNGSTTATSNDYFSLPSEKEIFGSTKYASAAAEADNSIFEYYETTANRYKKQGDDGNDNKYNYWERSPNSTNTNGFCKVDFQWTAGPNATRANANVGISPFGVI